MDRKSTMTHLSDAGLELSEISLGIAVHARNAKS